MTQTDKKSKNSRVSLLEKSIKSLTSLFGKKSSKTPTSNDTGEELDQFNQNNVINLPKSLRSTNSSRGASTTFMPARQNKSTSSNFSSIQDNLSYRHSFVHRDLESRPLTSSQAAFNLHDDAPTVHYPNGRTSTINTQDRLASNFRRMSVNQAMNLRDEDSDDEQQHDDIGYVTSTHSEWGTYARTGRDSISQPRRASCNVRESCVSNYRQSNMINRSTSVLSNRKSRLSAMASSCTDPDAVENLEVESDLRKSVSNADKAKQRNKDPRFRNRPTSAGTDSNARKGGNYYEDVGRPLSDTEVDCMEIENKFFDGVSSMMF